MWAFTLLMTGKKHADWLTHCPTRWFLHDERGAGGGGGVNNTDTANAPKELRVNRQQPPCARGLRHGLSPHTAVILVMLIFTTLLILPYIVWKGKKNKNSGSNLEKKPKNVLWIVVRFDEEQRERPRGSRCFLWSTFRLQSKKLG